MKDGKRGKHEFVNLKCATGQMFEANGLPSLFFYIENTLMTYWGRISIKSFKQSLEAITN